MIQSLSAMEAMIRSQPQSEHNTQTPIAKQIVESIAKEEPDE